MTFAPSVCGWLVQLEASITLPFEAAMAMGEMSPTLRERIKKASSLSNLHIYPPEVRVYPIDTVDSPLSYSGNPARGTR